MAAVPGPDPEPTAPLLDRSVLDDLRGLPGGAGGSALTEILALYRETAPSLLRGLRDAVGAGDLRAAERVAHTLRGSTLNLGGAALGVFAGRIEAAARGGDAEAARALMPEIEDLYRRTLDALGTEAGS